MAGQFDIRTFEGGMDKDTSKVILPKNKYVHAENYRLISDSDSNNFVFENSEGNILDLDLSGRYGDQIRMVGYCFIDKYLIMFMTTNIGEANPNGDTTDKRAHILLSRVERDGINPPDRIYVDSNAKGYLNLSTTYPIKAVGYYEGPDNIKVYWTDGYNEFRYMNVMDPDLYTQTINMFSVNPEFPDLSSLSLGTADSRIILDDVVDGRIKAASVQYTYQFYKSNGSSTRFAPLSAAIPVPFNNTNINTFRGGSLEEETGTGFRLKINVPTSIEFDRIRLVALDFYTYSSVPIVRIFGEYAIANSSPSGKLYFNDIGSTINEVAYEEFLTTGDTIYKAKDLEIKDSILFLANLQEDPFDVEFDARAYRHNSSGVARLYDSDLATYITTSTSGSGVDYAWENVPETHDCINLYNDPDNEGSQTYIYQSNGTTLGAQGRNVNVSFSSSFYDLDTYGTSLPAQVSTPDIPGKAKNAAYNRSFQRMEVYRLGIVFFDRKFNASSVKWVCDLKMPFWGYSSGNYAHVKSDLANTTEARTLGLNVSIQTMPSGAYAWQTVMVPRRTEDRSVLFNALLQTPGSTEEDGATYLHPLTDNTPTSSDTTIGLTTVADIYNATADSRNKTNILISPDINYYKEFEFKSGDFLQAVGHFEYDEAANTMSSISAGSTMTAYHKVYDFDANGVIAGKANITDFAIVNQTADTSAKQSVANIFYNNYATDSNDQVGLHGTVGVAYTSSNLPANGTGISTDKVQLVSYRRDIFSSQYGGIDYYSRQRNEYIGIGEIRYAGGVSNVIKEGDTYIDFFWYLKQSRDLADFGNSIFSTLLFPVESTVCSSLDYTRVERTNSLSSFEGTLMTESQGFYEGEDGSSSYSFDQTFDLYKYNFSYSIGSFGKYYYDELLDQSRQEFFPNRVRYSETKIAGEIEDSFTVFKANNYKDVSGEYGPINNLKSFRNNLFFWQKHAFGILSVNYRSLIQDNSASSLALGTGGVLERYDYVSTTVGNSNDLGIIASHKFLYWLDNTNNEFYKYGSDVSSLSKIGGIQSWLNKTGKVGWLIGTYDHKYNDVIFTFSFAREFSDVWTTDGYYVESFDYPGSGEISILTRYDVLVEGDTGLDNLVPKNNVLYYSIDDTRRWMLDNPVLGDDPDNINNVTDTSVYITVVNDPTQTYTLVYNERGNSFTSFESFKPRWYVKFGGPWVTSEEGQDFYLHSSGKANKGQFYGTYYPSVFTTVFNKEYPTTKVFDIVKWVSESKNADDIDQFKDTFSEVEFWNDYQHTGDRSLYYQHDTAPATRPSAISRRERTWSMQVPRNIVDMDVADNPDIFDTGNWDTSQTFKERIRDKHLFAKFTYTNSSSNNTFSVPFVATKYRKSFR